LGGKIAAISSWGDASITVTVPQNAGTGNVVVKTAGGITSNGVLFTVPPVITDLSPNSGTAGDFVFIGGSSLGSDKGSVSFNGVNAAFIPSWTATGIVVFVPVGATSGNVIVTSAGGTASNALAFSVVLPPNITALTPALGPVGSGVVISGSSFGATQGNGSVTFNGTPAVVTSWSDTRIAVAVAGGSTSGNVIVTTGSGDVSNAVGFTVQSAGPLLQLSISDTPLQVNLTSPQIIDWIHWGRIAATVPDRKGGITPLISDYTGINGAQPAASFGNIAFSWTDGNHPAVVSEADDDVETFNTASGFQITVPADTTAKTLNLYAEVLFGQGQLQASLSDGSAVAINDQSVIDSNVGSKIYSIDFRAASAGQTLTVTFSSANPAGGIGIQAATLTPHLPLVAIASPAQGQTFLSPVTVQFNAGATQFDDTITDVKSVGSDGTVLDAAASPLNALWGPLSGGHYTVTASGTDSAGLTNASSPVEFDVIGQGGSLSVQKSDIASPNIDLNAQGTGDWILWGPLNTGDLIIDNPGLILARKSGVAPLVSNYKPIGNHGIGAFIFVNGLSFTDGNQPYSSGSDLFVHGRNNGFEITAAADTSPRTLRLYVGAKSARGKLTAFLSDGSAAVVTDNSFDFPSPADANGLDGTAVYTVTYGAASSGQTLTLRYTVDVDYGGGQVALIGATLSGDPVTPTVPPPQIASISPESGPANTQVTITGTNFGATQGSSGVLFGESPQVVSWSDTSIVVTAPAFDGGTVVQVAVYTNNGISNGVNFTFPSYQFFPPSLSIVVGQVATVTAKDSQKQVVTGLSWSSSDPTIASVSDDGFITGVAPGSTTVYGGNVPLPVTVYAGTSLPPGTVLWSAPLGPGATRVTSLVPAVPSDSGADILTYDDAEFLSAFTSDGELLWRQGVLDVRKVMPDFAGNTLVSRRAVVIAADGTWHEHQVISRVDPNTGNLTDFYGYADKLVGSCTISPATGGSYQSLCYDDHTSFERAIPGVSGVLFVQENAAVTAVDIPTNQSLGSVTLNHGTTNLGGTVESVDPIYGQIIVAGDGNAYVPYSYGSTVVSHPGQQVAVFHKEDHSMVLRMSPDGTSANIELGAWNSDTTVTSSSGLPGIDPATVIDSEHDHWSGSTSFISSSVITNADTSVAVSGPINPGRCTDVYLGTYWTKDANGDTIFHPFYQTSGCPDSNHPHTEISYVSQDAVTSQVDVPLASFVPSLQREDGSYIGADNDRQLDAVALDGTPLWSKAIDHDVYGTAIPVTP